MTDRYYPVDRDTVDDKAPIESPVLTGDPQAPTPGSTDNDQSIATTAFVQTGLAKKANIASPTLTGTPRAPTPSLTSKSTQIATTAFVSGVVQAAGGDMTEAPIDGHTYGRKDALWAALPDTYTISWGDVTDKPATFPPTLPIPITGVTGLETTLAGKVANAGDVMTGQLKFMAGNPTTGASTNFPMSGTVTPVNDGDFWRAAGGFYYRTGGSTNMLIDDNTSQGINAQKVFYNRQIFQAGNTIPHIKMAPHTADPTVMEDGDMWFKSTGLYARVGGVTVGPFSGSPDLSGYAPLAGATFTGKVITPASTAASAGFNLPIGVAPTTPADGDFWGLGNSIYYRVGSTTHYLINAGTSQSITALKAFTTSPTFPTPGAGDNSTKGATTAYVDAADTFKVNKAGDTMTGKLNTLPSAVGGAGLNIGGTGAAAPTTPVSGDFWGRGSALEYQGTSLTYSIAFLNSVQTFTGAKTFSSQVTLKASTGSSSPLTMPHGTAPSAPVDGDLWSTSSGFYGRVSGVTVGPFGDADWNSIANKPASFPPSAHGHAESEITNLVTDLAAKLNLSGDTMTGKLVAPSTAARAGLNLGTAYVLPSPIADGDIWLDFGQTLKWRSSGATLTAVDANFQQSIAGAKSFTSPISPPGGTSIAPGVNIGTNTGIFGASGTSIGFTINGTAKLTMGVSTATMANSYKFVPAASSASRAGLNINNAGAGVAPTTPVEGDFWATTAGLFAYVNGATQKIGPGWTQMTQAAYDALGTKDPNMLYVIVG